MAKKAAPDTYPPKGTALDGEGCDADLACYGSGT